MTGGSASLRGVLYHLLRNPICIGKVHCKNELHDGQHALIADARRWRDARLNDRADSFDEITTREGLAKPPSVASCR